MSFQLHDLGNGTFNADRLLEARKAALREAVREESGLSLAAERMIGSGLGMSARQAEEQRKRTLARAEVLERWLLRPPDTP